MTMYYVTHTTIPSTKAHAYAISEMCAALARETAVVLVVPKHPSVDPHTLFEYYGLPPSFSVRTLSACNLFRFRRVLGRRLPYLIHLLSFTASLCFLRVATCDTVYLRHPLFLLAFLFRGARRAVEIHYASRLTAFALPLLSIADRIVVVTDSLKRDLAARGVPPAHVLTAPDAADISLFTVPVDARAAREELGLPPQRFIAAYAGNLYAWKGVYVLADALAMLGERYHGVFVGGAGEPLASFRAYLAARGYERAVAVGHVPHRRVPRYLGAADVLVLPNSAREPIASRYTSPLKLFEYMASGVPLVASDLLAIREVIDERHALLVPPDDAAALARAIETVAKHPAEARERARRARERSRSYSWDARARAIHRFISADLCA